MIVAVDSVDLKRLHSSAGLTPERSQFRKISQLGHNPSQCHELGTTRADDELVIGIAAH
jgi:hypothetical protein